MALAEVSQAVGTRGEAPRSLRARYRAGVAAIAKLAEVERLRSEAIAELVGFEAIGGHGAEGYLTPHRHLIDRAGLGEAEARRLVRLIRFCENHPSIAAQLADGRLTVEHADELRRLASRVDSVEFCEALPDLLAAAVGVELAVFVDRLRVWRWRVQPDITAEGLDTAYDNRALTLQPGLFGGLKLTGVLDPAGAAVVADGLRTRPDRTDTLEGPRTLAQRQADRLVELAGLAERLDAEPSPNLDSDHGGAEREGARQLSRPTVDVIVDLPTLLGAEFDLDNHRDAAGDVDWASIEAAFVLTGQAPRPVMQQFFCDASWRTLITAGGSAVLDYTHAKPEISRAQRRAVQRRDRHCQFAGCDRHWTWCDVHHLRPKEDGGWDLFDNLTLLCRRHHTMVHQQGWQLWSDTDGRIRTTTP